MGESNWRGMWCIEVAPAPGVMVLFGAAGDLAGRKLYPSLFGLWRQKLLHEDSRIIGCARRNWTEREYREYVRKFLPEADASLTAAFLEKLHFVNGDYQQPETYEAIKAELAVIDGVESAMPRNHLFYLALPASVYSDVVAELAGHGMLEGAEGGAGWRHVLIEKPFGYDLASAVELDRKLHKHLSEDQIYRIDHYLGKDTVQNITMLRFANLIFEPIWNAQYVDSVQITVAESLGVEQRGNYYDRAGCLRDMFQNHMLEMLSLAAMEMPQSFEANAVRDEKLKLIRSIRREAFKCPGRDFVRGQYVAGKGMPGYREELNIGEDSQTETYVAARMMIDNWRWRGVPFYLRSGKRMPKKCSEIAVRFKHIPHSIFAPIRSADLAPNELVLKVQPEEGMELGLQAKQPGPKLCMGTMTLSFDYPQAEHDALDAYARLLLDAMLGDQTLFIRSDIIEASWQLFSPVLDCWKNETDCSPLHYYEAGSAGPRAAEELLNKEGREWREL